MPSNIARHAVPLQSVQISGERTDEDLLDLVTHGSGPAHLTKREWARLAILAIDQAGVRIEIQIDLRENLGLICCSGVDNLGRHLVWCKNYVAGASR